MGSVLRILGGVALAFAGALAAAWSVIVAAVVPAATVTGLVSLDRDGVVSSENFGIGRVPGILKAVYEKY